jgi:hypothetical protein
MGSFLSDILFPFQVLKHGSVSTHYTQCGGGGGGMLATIVTQQADKLGKM